MADVSESSINSIATELNPQSSIGIFRDEEEQRNHVCKFLKADLEVDPELLKGTDRMKAQGFTAPAST